MVRGGDGYSFADRLPDPYSASPYNYGGVDAPVAMVSYIGGAWVELYRMAQKAI